MRKPVAERFWSKVDVKGRDQCWEWTASRSASGYGKFGLEGKTTKAHRVAYELAKGSVPAGLVVMHSCDNPPCVNPAHLSVGTHGDNMRDKSRKGRGFSPPSSGEHNGNARLTRRQVEQIRAWLSYGFRQREIAKWFGVGKSTVSYINTGERWSA